MLASYLPQLVQAVEGIRKNQENAKRKPVGTFDAVGSSEELDVFLAQGCDTLTVEVCPTLLGHDLFYGLKRACHGAQSHLQQIGWPTLVNNRIAYGLAALSWGGRTCADLHPWCLSASDFPTAKMDQEFWRGIVETICRFLTDGLNCRLNTKI